MFSPRALGCTRELGAEKEHECPLVSSLDEKRPPPGGPGSPLPRLARRTPPPDLLGEAGGKHADADSGLRRSVGPARSSAGASGTCPRGRPFPSQALSATWCHLLCVSSQPAFVQSLYWLRWVLRGKPPPRSCWRGLSPPSARIVTPCLAARPTLTRGHRRARRGSDLNPEPGAATYKL